MNKCDNYRKYISLIIAISIYNNKGDKSAYRPFHSTETALLNVQNDFLVSLDSSKGVINPA